MYILVQTCLMLELLQKNFDIDTLKQAIEYCNLRNVKSHLTLNILIKNNEFEDAVFLS